MLDLRHAEMSDAFWTLSPLIDPNDGPGDFRICKLVTMISIALDGIVIDPETQALLPS
jgi:hypothetical protein